MIMQQVSNEYNFILYQWVQFGGKEGTLRCLSRDFYTFIWGLSILTISEYKSQLFQSIMNDLNKKKDVSYKFTLLA